MYLHPYIIHIVFIITTVLFNMIMLWFYAVSIGHYGVSKATVYNFGITYIESVFLGYTVFNEEVTTWKLIAMGFIIAGVYLISDTK